MKNLSNFFVLMLVFLLLILSACGVETQADNEPEVNEETNKTDEQDEQQDSEEDKEENQLDEKEEQQKEQDSNSFEDDSNDINSNEENEDKTQEINEKVEGLLFHYKVRPDAVYIFDRDGEEYPLEALVVGKRTPNNAAYIYEHSDFITDINEIVKILEETNNSKIRERGDFFPEENTAYSYFVAPITFKEGLVKGDTLEEQLEVYKDYIVVHYTEDEEDGTHFFAPRSMVHDSNGRPELKEPKKYQEFIESYLD